ncbi:MAG: T9SS type A sorting domain-containing protein, partial [Bacteroidota bacterium]|nr:T9SS type A sorting domain-containing protein [Bacteroidota bacterium]
QKLFNLRHYCAPAGISSQITEENSIVVYPNPAAGELNVISTNNLLAQKNYIVRDLTGKLVLAGTLLNQTLLDISSLNQGIYYLELSDGERRMVKRFVKIIP